MSVEYKAVNWNRNKIVYDLTLLFAIILYLFVFVMVTRHYYSGENSLSMIIVLMRALSTCGFLMLTIILCIGPLTRIDHRFLPLLYNRRHFGLALFSVTLMHAALAVFWYHGFGVVNPIVSVFTSGGSYQSPVNLPYQVSGAMALVLLFLLAATSHDYWNTNLGAPLWKTIHMLVYPAYALLVLHVTLGALQQDNTGLLPVMVLGSVVPVSVLHVLAALRHSSSNIQHDKSEWVDVCRWQDIPNNRAVTVDIASDERIAVFRYDENKLCAVSNVCQHQNGPLGEGCVINGNIVCPWHGYEYRPDDGCSPPPFTEKIATYDLRLSGEHVQVNSKPELPGTTRPVIQIRDSTNE